MDNIYRPVNMAREFVKKHISFGDNCIDATCGNGNDTVFMANLVGSTGKILAFDIQDTAIENTLALVKNENMSDRVMLIKESHVYMGNYAEIGTVSAVMFNLGWLPKACHNIMTKKESTIKAINAAMELLKPNGIISICVYSGKDLGFEEKDAVLKELKAIGPKFNVIKLDYFNMPNDPPINLFIIKK